jgi:hypothetical protein
MMYPAWLHPYVAKATGSSDECYDGEIPPAPPPGPEIPAEVHNHQPFDAERAWAATLIACKGAQ